MEFTKTLMFLGLKRRTGEKGTSYTAQFFCPGGDNWDFWMADNRDNASMIAKLLGMSCGNMVDVSLKVIRFQQNGSPTLKLILTGIDNAV